jgi:hypothetical protein
MGVRGSPRGRAISIKEGVWGNMRTETEEWRKQAGQGHRIYAPPRVCQESVDLTVLKAEPRENSVYFVNLFISLLWCFSSSGFCFVLLVVT